MAEDDVTIPSVLDLPPPVLVDEEILAPFSAPAVGEVITALGRSMTPRWRMCYAAVAAPAPVEREQAALQLGVNSLELLLAAQARDGQHAAQMLSDGAALERVLGISEALRIRHARLQTLATAEEWETLRREIDALRDECAEALLMQRDEDLARLLPIGAWLRALHLEVVLFAAAPPEARPAAAGYSPPIVSWIETELEALSTTALETRSVGRARKVLRRLHRELEAARTKAPDYAGLAEELTETLTRLQTP